MHEIQAAIAREAPIGRRLAGPEEPDLRGRSSRDVGVDLLRELWVVCPRCQGKLYTRECEDNLKVCGRCRYHFRITPHERLAQLLDDGSFVEVDADLRAGDPLSFVVGGQPYTVKLREAALKSGTQEALIYGTGSIEGRSLVVAVHNFQFIGGSMGVAVGEKVSRAFDLAAELDLPFVAIVASGGARQHEGIYALMQMAKTVVALNRFKARHLPYISILTDPTFGGVPASYALLGDVNIAEPGALIGFAGPRVIEQMTMQALPTGVNSAEFMLLHGMLDLVVPRAQLRRTVASLLNVYSARAYRQALDHRRPRLVPPVMEVSGDDA
ncbi:MAG: acetyl-CoA carboxylase carboxyltransferase subunit beta [Chloroflexota bacterium]